MPPELRSGGRFTDALRRGLCPFDLPTRSKVPNTLWTRFRDTPMTLDQAAGLDGTDRNVGIITGAPSNAFVLDLDGPDAERFARSQGWLTETLTVRTARGLHFYYRMPDSPVRNRTGLASHVDIRGDGGYAIGAGSIHPDGQAYEIVVDADIAAAPEALLAALRPQPRNDSLPASAPGNACQEFAEIVEQMRAAPDGTRNDTLNKLAFRAGQLIADGLIGAAEAEDGLFEAATASGLDPKEVEQVLRRALHDGQAKPRNKASSNNLSQRLMAKQWARQHGSARRYDHSRGKWMRADPASGIWHRDDTSATFDEIASHVHLTGGGDKRYSNIGFVRGTEAFAQALPEIAVTSEVFDTEPMILGTPLGPVDLERGALLPPDPLRYVSRSTSVSPASGTPVRWLRFLYESTGDDADMVEYLQRTLGYGLTGLTNEQALFFIYGDGGNGKGVFVNVTRRIMGDYAETAAMETFTASRSDQHPTNLAKLRGARLVTASETEHGRAWAESRIKQLTGNDEISARFMRQDFFSFVPVFKLLIIGNFHPLLNAVDDAMRRRFNIIPFNRKPLTPNPNLEAELEKEFPQILNWMLEGCRKWRAGGLQRPQAVSDATADYFEEQDVFGQWLAQFCEVGPALRENSHELFHNWSLFAKEVGEDVGSLKGFGSLLTKRGFRADRETSGKRARFWRGLRLQRVHIGGREVIKTPQYANIAHM
ncbi:phage/plasmid primase, P4 family [Novosphingobium huizhouense]|uniref:phage/plasmid primase, P4 family n=1 Tax=Novosphingobium huizhouense TaxID=2866625 RepID=UPI001CD90F23|nr:phage/plasmid primase, P4 family [Novosphingobium huizhouense]